MKVQYYAFAVPHLGDRVVRLPTAWKGSSLPIMSKTLIAKWHHIFSNPSHNIFSNSLHLYSTSAGERSTEIPYRGRMTDSSDSDESDHPLPLKGKDTKGGFCSYMKLRPSCDNELFTNRVCGHL